MLFALPALAIYIFYIVIAVAPAAVLLRYVWKKDRMEKEPPVLLLRLLLVGVSAAFVSIVLERIGTGVLNIFVDSRTARYKIILSFLVVAVVEEGAKYAFLKWRTWNHPSFNYRFDGIVYSVFVSLGFAAFENVKYVLNGGLSVALPRALLAVPGHMGFAVFMGVYYGRAKVCEQLGENRGRDKNLRLGLIAAVLLHGFYDSCAMIGNVLSTLLFAAFVVIMDIAVIRTVRRESENDRPIF